MYKRQPSNCTWAFTFILPGLRVERINTEFVKVIDEHTLQMRVWERGSGETLACGTGACATAVPLLALLLSSKIAH